MEPRSFRIRSVIIAFSARFLVSSASASRIELSSRIFLPRAAVPLIGLVSSTASFPPPAAAGRIVQVKKIECTEILILLTRRISAGCNLRKNEYKLTGSPLNLKCFSIVKLI